MTDAELTRALERCELPDGFHHADHLRVALVYLNESPDVQTAIDRMGATLRRFAASVGKAEKYSQPVTEFWMYQMAAARALAPGATADGILQSCPRLLDKNLILAYYSGDAAASGSTNSPRNTPDRPLPGHAA